MSSTSATIGDDGRSSIATVWRVDQSDSPVLKGIVLFFQFLCMDEKTARKHLISDLINLRHLLPSQTLYVFLLLQYHSDQILAECFLHRTPYKWLTS
jgi:hypothetical protein